MKILIVEDDENKRKHLLNFLSDEFPVIETDTAKSYHSGLKKIVEERYDLVLLDMTIPTFDITNNEEGGRTQAFGGKEILKQMKRRGIKMPVLVITQFDRFGDTGNLRTLDELKLELKETFSDNYLDSIYYNVTVSEWRDNLKNFLNGFKEN